jgi:hypothetical protein
MKIIKNGPTDPENAELSDSKTQETDKRRNKGIHNQDNRSYRPSDIDY